MFAIAPTLLDWLERMREPGLPREVNFWTPTPWGVRQLSPGNRFYFLLKAPHRKVGGYGHFVRYEELTAQQAWNSFGRGNGADSAAELVENVSTLALKNAKNFVKTSDPNIGCIVLRDVNIFDDVYWVRPEEAGYFFPNQVVKLKYFTGEDRLVAMLGAGIDSKDHFTLVPGKAARRASTEKDRKGQPAFRAAVLENYGFRCAVLRTRTAEILEAAHVQPYIDERSNHPQNGICLRVDLHRLFDAGLIAVTTDGKLSVSKRLSDTGYAKLNGKSVWLPTSPECRPADVALEFHRSEVFR